MLREEKHGGTVVKEYNWGEDWEAENRFMDAINQWGGSCHTVERYWEDEDEDGSNEANLDGRE